MRSEGKVETRHAGIWREDYCRQRRTGRLSRCDTSWCHQDDSRADREKSIPEMSGRWSHRDLVINQM